VDRVAQGPLPVLSPDKGGRLGLRLTTLQKNTCHETNQPASEHKTDSTKRSV